jgi:hypothetical protein
MNYPAASSGVVHLCILIFNLGFEDIKGGIKMKKFFFPLIIILLISGMIGVVPAEGYIFRLDDLYIEKTGGQVPGSGSFHDDFNSGLGYVTPPAPPLYGGAAPFSTLFPYNSEVDGKLIFNSQYAVTAGVVPLGYAAIIQNARLNPFALAYDDKFSATALFDLIEPGPGEVYAIRLYDPGSSITNLPSGGFVELRLRKALDPNSPATLQFRRGDYFQQDGKTYIDVFNIDNEVIVDFTKGYDQIALTLSHSSHQNAVTASFTYYDDGEFKSNWSFNQTGSIFTDNSKLSQVEFQAGKSWSVPEPTTMLLLGLGLIGLAGIRRRYK